MRSAFRVCRDRDVALLDQLNPAPSVRSFHSVRYAQQQAGTATYVVAWRRGVPCGHALIKWDGCDAARIRDTYPGCPEIACLEVFPSPMRGHGIGTGLIRHAQQRARERGCGLIGLGVADSNPRAAALYRRLGYDGTQAYIDRYRCVDSLGGIHNFASPCVFLVKAL